MTKASGLYDKITIGGETFRGWHSSPELQVMQDGAWTSIPYVANRAILAMIENMNAAISDEREACAKIVDPIDGPENVLRITRKGLAAAIRARGQT